ncbi:hypothetical protein [Paradesulfitobacterium ferrireducens]|uniref:hypothetical protein n=1 Tax=Paradesulfitobacterium ferrireducens TaxID=2816476 RepID=UPI001A8CDFD8|nr:hypothetical protein [Paradesulfitobacterium ferrireducens]
MAVALFQEQIDFHLFVKRSLEALTDDFEFLFRCLQVHVSLAAAYVEGFNSGFPRALLRQTCEALPVRFTEYFLTEKAGLAEAVALIHSLNQADDIHGLIIDLPPYPGVSQEQLSIRFNVEKKVELADLDDLMPWEYDLTPHEEEILKVLLILEKTFSKAAEQIARLKGYVK